MKGYELRSGFSHILAVFDKIDEGLLPDSKEEVLCVRYDKKAEAAKNDIMTIREQHRSTQSLSCLALKPNNIIFDLRNFGFYPKSRKKLAEIYDDVVFDGNPVMLEPYQCRDLIENEQLDNEIRKYLLDIYIFIASGIQILVTMEQGKAHALKQYSIILSNIFITGAKIEELIFLVARIDSSLEYYKKLKKAKRIRSVFLKNSGKTELKIVKKLRNIVEDYELFTQKFRTPEGHKKGRMFPLISEGYYGTLFNEIMSFNNALNGLFGEIVAYLKSETQDSKKFLPSQK
ncbi:hypothetical protein KAS79_02350 [Candidatus Parcubacteria bacterium]|nr:hypothetical protein [Candidatus Parcubacteria bacterium]